MPKTLEPVTETEVAQVVKEALVKAFGKRPVPPGVIRRALAQVNFDLIQLELKEVSAGSPSGPAGKQPRRTRGRQSVQP